MHESTIQQFQGGRRRQLPPALHLTRSRVELLLFSGAIAVLALHAAVDSFIAPEPGTGPGDHLLRGGVTLAILSGSAYLYPRLPAGGRAAIAAVLGALALEGAVLAVSDARAVGARGEDWTGFLLFPVGLVLIVLAAVRLWRSRKPGRLRWLRRGALGFVTVVLAYWFVVPVAMAILSTHRPRAAVEQVSLGRPSEQVTLRTSDGLQLAGWYVRSRNGAAVISYPTREGKVPQARMLARHGYGVLLLDARGYDGSQGDPNLFGWDDAKDIDAAVAWLRRQPDVHDGRIGGIGFSVGGEMMLQAAAANTGLARGRVGWRRLSLSPRGAAVRAARLVHVTARAGGAERGAHGDERDCAAAFAQTPRAAHRAAARLLHLRRPRRRWRGIQLRLLRGRRSAESDLEDPGGEPHRRLRGTTTRVRATRRRLLRPRPPRKGVNPMQAAYPHSVAPFPARLEGTPGAALPCSL